MARTPATVILHGVQENTVKIQAGRRKHLLVMVYSHQQENDITTVPMSVGRAAKKKDKSQKCLRRCLPKTLSYASALETLE